MRGTNTPARVRGALLAFLALVVAVALVGCGSSSTASSGSNGGGAAPSSQAKKAGLAEAQKAEKQWEKIPDNIGVTTPTKVPIPTGKTIAYIYCGAPVCQTLSAAIQKAAGILGWHYKEISSNGTPSGVKAAWDTAVRLHPDAVFGSGFDTPIYASELKQLTSMGVGVFNYSTADPGKNGGVTFRIGDAQQIGSQGNIMASWVVSDSKGNANTLFVNVPAYTELAQDQSQFKSAYSKWCPGCGYDSINLPVTALGTSAATQPVVSYLQAHPTVNYVVYSLDGADVGLPSALKAAGLSDKVKFVGASPSIENLGYLAAGQEGALAAQGYYEEEAHLVDAAARWMTHQSLAPDENYGLAFWLETPQNQAASGGQVFKPVDPNLTAQLKKLWGK